MRVEVGVGEAGVDLDERVEAAERAPRGGHDALGALPRASPRAGSAASIASVTSAIARSRDGFDQGLAGGEVHVDRGPHHARPASDLGHAGLGIARQRVEGAVEDAVEAALRVGASGRAGGRHRGSVDGDGRCEPELRQEAGGGGQDRKREHARDGGEGAGDEEGVADAAGERRGGAGPRAPSDPVAIVASTAMPSEPPISWPVVLSPESIPVSSSRRAGEHRDRDARRARRRGRGRRPACRGAGRRRSCRRRRRR